MARIRYLRAAHQLYPNHLYYIFIRGFSRQDRKTDENNNDNNDNNINKPDYCDVYIIYIYEYLPPIMCISVYNIPI